MLTDKFNNIVENIINDIKLNIDDEHNLFFPKIIIIGTKACGKSLLLKNILENIIKYKLFPKNNKICTIAPIYFKLRNVKLKNENNNIHYNIKYILNNEKIEINGNDTNDIYNIINKYFKSLNYTYSENEIEILLFSNNFPNLEFYDLPGLVEYPINNAKITKNIIDKYLNKENIILCIENAENNNLSSSHSIAMIKNKNLEDKSILILNKIEKLNNINIDKYLFDRILYRTEEIKKINFTKCIGIIINNESLLENDNYSIILNKYVYDKINIINNLGINNLIININNFYDNYINDIWKSKILLYLKNQILNYENNIELFGININSTDIINIINIILDIIHDIIKKIIKNIKNEKYSCITFRKYIKYNKIEESLNNSDSEYASESDNDSNNDNDNNNNTIKIIYNIYNNLNKLLNNEYEFTIKKFNIQEILISKINNFFVKDNIKYNLYRFDKFKNKLIIFINKKIDQLLLINHIKIYEVLSNNILNNYTNVYSYTINEIILLLEKKYYNLFRFFIIYPLFEDESKFTNELFDYLDISDFEESSDIIKNKKLLLDNINYINLKINEIENI
jgi:hypothetical protein